MARYFAGNSLAAFGRTSTSLVESTTSGRFDSGFVDSSLTLPANVTDFYTSATFSATGTVWLRFDLWNNIFNWSSPTGNGVSLYNGNTGIWRLIQTSAQVWQPQYFNGTSWVNTGTAVTASNGLYTFAVQITLGSGFTLYLGGSSVSSGSGWTGSATTATNVRLYGLSTTNNYAASQIMVADYDIRDSKYAKATLNGNSAANTGQASGVYTDVNEIVLDDSTAISITTSGNKAGQTHAALTVGNGYYIAAMAISARGRASGTITDGKLGARSGGTNYSSAALGYNAGYEPRQSILSNDPATSTSWTTSGFNSAEIYEEAA